MIRRIHVQDLTDLTLLKTHELYFEELLTVPKEKLREINNFCIENKTFRYQWKEKNDYGYFCDYSHNFCIANRRLVTRAAAKRFLDEMDAPSQNQEDPL